MNFNILAISGLLISTISILGMEKPGPSVADENALICQQIETAQDAQDATMSPSKRMAAGRQLALNRYNEIQQLKAQGAVANIIARKMREFIYLPYANEKTRRMYLEQLKTLQREGKLRGI